MSKIDYPAERYAEFDAATATYYRYLDELRDGGATNMMGASAYLRREYGVSVDVARDTLFAWIDWMQKQPRNPTQ